MRGIQIYYSQSVNLHKWVNEAESKKDFNWENTAVSSTDESAATTDIPSDMYSILKEEVLLLKSV